MRPQSIVRFRQLYIAKITLGVIATLVGLSGVRHVPPGMETALSSSEAITALLLGLVLGLAMQLLLLHLVANRASDVARWIVVLFFLCECGGLGFAMWKGSFFTLASAPVSLASFLASAACVWLLFRRDSARWFRGEGRGTPSEDTKN